MNALLWPCTEAQIPLAECLKDTVERFLPRWHDLISPAVRSGKRVLMAAVANQASAKK